MSDWLGRPIPRLEPAPTTSNAFCSAAPHNNGNCLGRIHGRQDRPAPSCYHDNIDLATHQLGDKRREPLTLPLRISVLDGDVLSFDVATLAQRQLNCLGTGGVTCGIDRISHQRKFLRLLRVGERSSGQKENCQSPDGCSSVHFAFSVKDRCA
jgi:hypothetical protein